MIFYWCLDFIYLCIILMLLYSLVVIILQLILTEMMRVNWEFTVKMFKNLFTKTWVKLFLPQYYVQIESILRNDWYLLNYPISLLQQLHCANKLTTSTFIYLWQVFVPDSNSCLFITYRSVEHWEIFSLNYRMSENIGPYCFTYCKLSTGEKGVNSFVVPS